MKRKDTIGVYQRFSFIVACMVIILSDIKYVLTTLL
ncbi:uncharacterized protein METZ01_LOCUS445863, partial [marine metagenome]